MNIDSRTRARIRAVYPGLAFRYYRLAYDLYALHKKCVRITEGFRSFTRQRKLFSLGRDKPGSVVTNARAGQSFHNYGLAIDVCFVGPDPYLEKDVNGPMYWDEFGRTAKGHGFAWGGDFNGFQDRPHIQLTYGLTLRAIQKLYDFGGIEGVWTRLDQIRGVDCEWKRSKVKILNP